MPGGHFRGVEVEQRIDRKQFLSDWQNEGPGLRPWLISWPVSGVLVFGYLIPPLLDRGNGRGRFRRFFGIFELDGNDSPALHDLFLIIHDVKIYFRAQVFRSTLYPDLQPVL